MKAIHQYIIEKYLGSTSAYLKLERYPKIGKKLIVQKWLEDHQDIKKSIENEMLNLIVFEENDASGDIYYMNESGICVLYYDKTHKYLWISNKVFFFLIAMSDVHLVIKYFIKYLSEINVINFRTTNFKPSEISLAEQRYSNKKASN